VQSKKQLPPMHAPPACAQALQSGTPVPVAPPAAPDVPPAPPPP
jgi:hypothetical protein